MTCRDVGCQAFLLRGASYTTRFRWASYMYVVRHPTHTSIAGAVAPIVAIITANTSTTACHRQTFSSGFGGGTHRRRHEKRFQLHIRHAAVLGGAVGRKKPDH